MHRTGGIAALAALAGCLSTPSEALFDAAGFDAVPPVCADGDGDRWPAGQGGACATTELDCDDDDALEHPGAYESGDGVENVDCDGIAWDGVGRMSAIDATTIGADLMVTIGSLELRIDGEQGHSISEMRVIGASGNLLYTGSVQERLVAIEAWQSFFSWEDAGAEDVRTELVRNRAILRFQVDWQDGSDMDGITTWTMHAGGRLYRRDEVTLSTQPTQSNVTAYVALDDTAATHIDFDTNGAAIPLAFGPDVFDTWATTPPSEQWLCAYHDTGGYEIGFLADATTSTTTESVRITRSQGPTSESAQAALQYDWNFGGGPAAIGSYNGSFQIIAGPSNLAGPCDLTETSDDAWRNPPGLVLRDGEAGTAPNGEDFNGDGFAEGGGYWPITATTAPFEIELMSGGAVPATISFRIEGLPPGDPVITVEHDRAVTRYVHGRDYLLAEEGGFTWLVIRASLGNVIRIVPPPVPPF